ncbi:hypothetical protein BV25DRAFT_1823341 [Artomyces pyxidatus]|uniref:Uncharacterized protein n=1 Tax=Artomyces pyxidatus TaxID=48021 RepID=A0ACB8T799_9AGAM|nr:hypothetical protein BV25DRAFT_1823341 [Artomyces pyxidatus]
MASPEDDQQTKDTQPLDGAPAVTEPPQPEPASSPSNASPPPPFRPRGAPSKPVSGKPK